MIKTSEPGTKVQLKKAKAEVSTLKDGYMSSWQEVELNGEFILDEYQPRDPAAHVHSNAWILSSEKHPDKCYWIDLEDLRGAIV